MTDTQQIRDADGNSTLADLIFSPDDAGYYWQRVSDGAVSRELYVSRRAALDNPPHWHDL